MPNKKFDYSLNYKLIDCRKNPEFYTIGKGEQGVLLVEPYKSEILPHWRFKTPDIAQASAEKIYQMFLDYKSSNDFPGMDMCKKFLNMGYSRARRYANHADGKKYDGPVPDDQKGRSGSHGRNQLPIDADEEKAECARKFYPYWMLAKNDEDYKQMALKHKEKFEKV